MTREWKPGDVAMVTLLGGTDREYIAEFRQHGGRAQWFGSWNGFGAEVVQSARPLVVIDPEDSAAVDALAKAWDSLDGETFALGESPMTVRAYRMQAALREFANPTPPKPDEPTGLGAVVEDAEGELWIRLVSADDGPDDDWCRVGSLPSDGKWTFYADIAAVRVLSEGIRRTAEHRAKKAVTP